MNQSSPTSASSKPATHGDVIVWADVAGTALFVLTATYAAVVFSQFAQWIGAVTAMILFTVGVAAFIWSFYNAVQRSREEEIAVTQVYLLLGDPVPKRVRRPMLLLLVAQIVTATVTALSRTESSDGSPGTSLAVGILVPMFGIGMNGLWAAFHGDFPPRRDLVEILGDEATPNGAADTITDGGGADGSRIGQNGAHG